MSRIVWDDKGKRYYETGVDQAVLYVDGKPGVPWNGLTSINKTPLGGEAKPFFIDGEKFLNYSTPEEYEATLSAFTYPDEFEECDGTAEPRTGFYFTGQRRKSFGLTYRTIIGNDLTENDYKIHIVYNALAQPTTRGHKTHTDSRQVIEFMWKLTSMPPVVAGYRRTSHVILDSRFVDPTVLSAIEDVLYGNDAASARLPQIPEILDLIDSGDKLTVVDNGDGTYSLTAPESNLFMLDDNTFQLDWPTGVTDNGDGTFTASS